MAVVADGPAPTPSPNTKLVSDSVFKYELLLPLEWESKPKPVKTHQHEALFAGPGPGAMKAGITVDPVKIKALEDFGTPEEVAERIITVEKGRDGVKTVSLRQVDAARGSPSYYTVEYLTESSRGIKVFRCKYCITSRGLYVLQAQANANVFDAQDASVRDSVRNIVDSFT
ncbi:MAG: hypothetical protein SGPRY_013327, partial [Prymnesium sp.]